MVWSNAIFLLIVLSGMYLWIPRRWNWQSVKVVALFRGGLSGKARDFNWHNVIGIWSAVPLALVVATAMPISFSWASNLIYMAVGDTPPQQGGGPGGGRGGVARQAKPVRVANLDQRFARAEQQVADWRSINLRLPIAADAPLAFAIDQGNGG